MERILTYTVSSQEASTYETVGRVIHQQLGLTKRQISQAKFRAQGICVNGSVTKVNQRLQAGDCIAVKIAEDADQSTHMIPMQAELEILYEDQDLILVNKPAGVPVHPAHGHYQDSLVNMLAYYFEQKKECVSIRPVGRLDLETSGVMVFAKNQPAAANLNRQKQQGTFYKEYLAMVSGILYPKFGEIRTPIGPMPGELNRMQVYEQSVHDSQNSIKSAWTCYQVESEQNKAEAISLLRVHIHTGRTHQIRVHMASIGHALLGDCCYNPHPETHLIGRTALHAETVCLFQPFTGEQLKFHAMMPQDMRHILLDI